MIWDIVLLYFFLGGWENVSIPPVWKSQTVINYYRDNIYSIILYSATGYRERLPVAPIYIIVMRKPILTRKKVKVKMGY